MGKKENWYVAVKRVFSPESKEKKAAKQVFSPESHEKKAAKQESPKSKKKWGFGKTSTNTSTKPVETPKVSAPETSAIPPRNPSPSPSPSPPPPPPPTPPVVEFKTAVSPRERDKEDVYSAALATAEAAVAAARAAAEVVRLTASAGRISTKSNEEVTAIKIQTAFRAYLARKCLRSLRGLDRLKSQMNSNAVKRQAINTMQCMQTLTRMQSEIRSRRIKMREENQALQRQLQLKRERELEALRVGTEENDWDDSLLPKEKVEASIVNKHEATKRREKALAYAYTHQWRSSSKSVAPMFTDPNNPQWGWSWMERWMAARPRERSTTTKDTVNDKSSIKSGNVNVGDEILKAYAQYDPSKERPSPMSRKSSRLGIRPFPSTSPSMSSSAAGGRIRSASPRAGYYPFEDDSRSMFSTRSERNRRHSVSLAGSSIRDDESLASSPAIPNYMSSTESARARSRIPSPSPRSKVMSSDGSSSVSSARKRLSFPASNKPGMLSPAAGNSTRRHSGPPTVGQSRILS